MKVQKHRAGDSCHGPQEKSCSVNPHLHYSVNPHDSTAFLGSGPKGECHVGYGVISIRPSVHSLLWSLSFSFSLSLLLLLHSNKMSVSASKGSKIPEGPPPHPPPTPSAAVLKQVYGAQKALKAKKGLLRKI